MAILNVMFDSVSGKMVWNDGTHWRDSTGVIIPTPASTTITVTGDVAGSGSAASPIATKLKTDETTIRVSKNPLITGFTSIATALASITDESLTKHYTISVASGTYVEPTIVLRPYIHIIGDNRRSVIITPIDHNQSIMIGAPYCTVKQVTFKGATNPNHPAVVYYGSPIDNYAGEEFRLTSVQFQSNAHHFRVYGSDTLPLVSAFLDDIFIIVDANTVTGLSIYGPPTSHSSYVLVYCNLLTIEDNGVSDLSNWSSSVFVTGTGSIFLLNSYRIVATRDVMATGVHVQDGANVRIQDGLVAAFAKNCYMANVGVGSTLRVVGTSSEIFPGTAQTPGQLLHIEHPDGAGSYFGIVDQKHMIIDAPRFSVVASDPNGGFIASGPLYMGRTYNDHMDIEPLVRLGPPMGLYDGGDLSDGGGLTVNVAPGQGYFTDPDEDSNLVNFSWDATSIDVPPWTCSHIYINNNRILTASPELPSDLAACIYLGNAVSADDFLATIGLIPSNVRHFSNQQDRYNRLAFGPIYVSGSIVAENTTTPFALDVGSGHYFISTTEFSPTGGTEVTLLELWGVPVQRDRITTVPLQYANGTTLINLPNGRFTKHSLYATSSNATLAQSTLGGSDVYCLVVGQAHYSTQIEAEQAVDPTPPVQIIAAQYVHIADIVVQQGASNISAILDTRPVLGFRSPGLASASTHGNLLGLTDDDHPQYLLQSGMRPMTGNLDLSGNNIINCAQINGLNVTTHGSRHLPNGADPLATAVAIALTPTTSNTVGIQNSLARSDHTHAITGFATVAVSGLYTDLINKPVLAPVATSGSYDDLEDTPVLTPVATSGSYDDLEDTPVLAPVATSGSYDDLDDKPAIPASTSDLTNDSGFVTGNQPIVLSGDATGSGTTAITLTLANTAVAAGAGYNTFTVDAKGRITAASAITYQTPQTTLVGYGITDAYTKLTSDARYLQGNQSISITGDVTGSGTTAITLTLPNTTVTAGAGYNTFTVDAKGRITAASTVTYQTPQTTLAGYGITDAYTKLTSDARYLQGNQSISITGDATGSGTTAITLTLANTAVTAGAGYNTFTVDAKGRITAASTTTYLTANQSISITGDATGSGTTAITLTLANTAVAAGAGYNTFTVDAKGRITAASTTTYLTANQSISIIGDISGSGTTAITATLPTSGVTAGTYQGITVNSKGLITAASTVMPSIDPNFGYQVPVTGFNYTLVVTQTIFDPAGTLANGTITFPANPVNGQYIRVATSKQITSLTLAGNGKTISNAVNTLAAGAFFTYMFRSTNNTWYRTG